MQAVNMHSVTQNAASPQGPCIIRVCGHRQSIMQNYTIIFINCYEPSVSIDSEPSDWSKGPDPGKTSGLDLRLPKMKYELFIFLTLGLAC